MEENQKNIYLCKKISKKVLKTLSFCDKMVVEIHGCLMEWMMNTLGMVL